MLCYAHTSPASTSVLVSQEAPPPSSAPLLVLKESAADILGQDALELLVCPKGELPSTAPSPAARVVMSPPTNAAATLAGNSPGSWDRTLALVAPAAAFLTGLAQLAARESDARMELKLLEKEALSRAPPANGDEGGKHSKRRRRGKLHGVRHSSRMVLRKVGTTDSKGGKPVQRPTALK